MKPELPPSLSLRNAYQYADLGSPKEKKRPKPAFRPASENPWLPLSDARKIINSAAYAASIGKPLCAHVTFHWRMSEGFDPEPRAWIRHQGDTFEAMRDWLKRRGVDTPYLWVREDAAVKQWHTHLLASVPPELWDDLKAFLLKSGHFRDPPPGVTDEAIKITGGFPWKPGAYLDTQWAGLVRYVLKSVSPRASLGGENVWEALALDDRAREPCTIFGKRSGCSRSISREARHRANWRELFTLPELRGALPLSGEKMRLPPQLPKVTAASRGFAFAGLRGV